LCAKPHIKMSKKETAILFHDDTYVVELREKNSTEFHIFNNEEDARELETEQENKFLQEMKQSMAPFILNSIDCNEIAVRRNLSDPHSKHEVMTVQDAIQEINKNTWTMECSDLKQSIPITKHVLQLIADYHTPTIKTNKRKRKTKIREELASEFADLDTLNDAAEQCLKEISTEAPHACYVCVYSPERMTISKDGTVQIE